MAAKAVVKVPEANSRSKMVIKVIKVIVSICLSIPSLFLIIDFLLDLIDYSFITFFLVLTFRCLFIYLWAAGKVLNKCA
jgi:hypothetical protein